MKETRICCKCNKELSEGYVVHLDKRTYIYCSEACMNKDRIDMDKFEEINDKNPGDSYYYNWNQ